MAIKYYLQPNAITTDPNDQFARVMPGIVHNLDTVITQMLKRGSTITESDIKAVLTMFFKVVIDELVDGNFVNLPLVNLRTGVNGVFTNAADSFDASRHSVRATVSAGIDLWDALLAAKLEKQTQAVVSPYLLQYEDVNSATYNSVVTKGGIGVIIGNELKYDTINVNEGVFFVNSNGKIAVVAGRTAGKLTFSIPRSLAAGAYTLEVHKAYTQAKTIRSGVLVDKLTDA